MIFGHFIGFSHILSWDRSLYIPVYIIITHCTSDTENQSFQTTYGKIIARSALSVGLRFKSRCASVCLSDVTDFGSIPLGLQRRGHATAYWCFDARIRFLLFLTKTDQFEIGLRGGRSGLGVPKTVHFRQKRTSLKSGYGAGGLDWGSQKLLIFAKNGPVWNRVTGREVWIGGPKNCSFSPKTD